MYSFPILSCFVISVFHTSILACHLSHMKVFGKSITMVLRAHLENLICFLIQSGATWQFYFLPLFCLKLFELDIEVLLTLWQCIS